MIPGSVRHTRGETGKPLLQTQKLYHASLCMSIVKMDFQRNFLLPASAARAPCFFSCYMAHFVIYYPLDACGDADFPPPLTYFTP